MTDLPAKVTRPHIVVDDDQKCLHIDGEILHLTRAEFALAAYLSANPKHVKSRTQILDYIYGNAAMTERSVDSLVKRVRIKTKTLGVDPIHTRSGFGYYWDV